MDEFCYCGNSLTYEECCGAIHNGTREAKTAEELMRSRYSAFVLADIDFILKTYASENRPVEDRQELLNWAKSVKWIKLEVLKTKLGTKADIEGIVEFKAHFFENRLSEFIHEKSYFIKENGSWVYVSGEFPNTITKESLPGRNELCFCGSGKKFKKCCFGK